MASNVTGRRWEWLLAVGLFCLALGQLWGHWDGSGASFVEGFGVGVALGTSVVYLVLAGLGRGRRA